jgi:hypothetical protein
MLKTSSPRLLSNRVIFMVVTCLVLTFIIDTTFAVSYDLVSKTVLSTETKKIIFSLIAIICLILQFIIQHYTKGLAIKSELGRRLRLKVFERLSQFAFYFIAVTVSYLIFQLFYFGYYYTFTLMLIVLVAYGTASVLIGKTAILFFSWYRQTHNYVILMYFVSLSLILFTLVLTDTIVNIHLNARPDKIREFLGGTMDVTGGRYSYFNLLYKISTIVSFLSIWLTTSILMYSAGRGLIRQIRNWVMPIALLAYFLTIYLFQEIYKPILFPILKFDPILLSIVLIMIFTLAKPVGGIMFGVTFWNISRKVSFEKTLRGYMILSGYGFLLLFGTNQASSLVLTPYPPFGIATVTILIVSSYLIMVGIYTSAALVSINNKVRNSVHEIAKESKLLDFIGKAELEKEITKIVKKDSKETEMEEDIAKTSYNLDEQDLKDYIIEVADELRKKKSN